MIKDFVTAFFLLSYCCLTQLLIKTIVHSKSKVSNGCLVSNFHQVTSCDLFHPSYTNSQVTHVIPYHVRDDVFFDLWRLYLIAISGNSGLINHF